jgi:hypothetical protein
VATSAAILPQQQCHVWMLCPPRMLTADLPWCYRAAPSAWLPDSIVAGDSPEAHAADLAVELVRPLCYIII